MTGALDFQLDLIDRKATKENVEKALEQYRIFLLTEELDQLPKVTQDFSFVPPSHTNKFYSSTESVAIKNVDYEIKRREYIKKVSKAVNRLGYKERSIIISRYMTSDDVYDYQVYNDLHISERTYHRYKSKAFYKLAFVLRIEVYKDSEAIESATNKII